MQHGIEAISVGEGIGVAFVGLETGQAAILVSTDASSLGTSAAEYVKSTEARDVRVVNILRNGPQRAITPSEMLISSGKYMDLNAAGIVIFPPGTTDPPKGAVMRRG